MDNFISYDEYINNHYQNLTFSQNETLFYFIFPIKEEFINTILNTVNNLTYDKTITLLKQSNNMIKTLLDPFIQLNQTLFFLQNGIINYTSQINYLQKLVTMIDNFSSYKTEFIQDFTYFVKIERALGKIVPIIFFALLLTFVVASGALLITYYCKKRNQQWWILPMHIAWNGLRTFIVLFFIYGTLYGMVFLYSRDLIAYLKYAFSEENLNSNNIVIIPSKSQNFLQYCLINPYIYEDFKENNTINELIKNIVKIDSFINNNQICPNIDKDIKDACESMKTSLLFDYSQFVKEIDNDVKYFKNKIRKDVNIYDAFNCTFINNTINLMYRGLWDFAWEARILCALSCCIGFFGEIVANFYILVMYHYDNNEFKEGNLDMSRSRNIFNKRNYDVSSRNEFLDKTKPANMKKFNKELDLEFS